MVRPNDSPRLLEDGGVNDRHKGSVAPDPHVDWIVDSLVFQPGRAAIVDVGADAFGVGEHHDFRCSNPQQGISIHCYLKKLRCSF
jgi:hypothetical protein